MKRILRRVRGMSRRMTRKWRILSIRRFSRRIMEREGNIKKKRKRRWKYNNELAVMRGGCALGRRGREVSGAEGGGVLGERWGRMRCTRQGEEQVSSSPYSGPRQLRSIISRSALWDVYQALYYLFYQSTQRWWCKVTFTYIYSIYSIFFSFIIPIDSMKI